VGRQIAGTSREEFYAELTSLLHELRPGRSLPDPQPETHLWADGYVDSLGMLEIIYFLEDRLGCEIDLTGDFLPNFFTLKSIYDTYVTPAGAGGAGSRDTL
jgi:acyl carrier protein